MQDAHACDVVMYTITDYVIVDAEIFFVFNIKFRITVMFSVHIVSCCRRLCRRDTSWSSLTGFLDGSWQTVPPLLILNIDDGCWRLSFWHTSCWPLPGCLSGPCLSLTTELAERGRHSVVRMFFYRLYGHGFDFLSTVIMKHRPVWLQYSLPHLLIQ